MEIVVSGANSAPIYEQIATQIRDAILAGELGEGELLPSIRTLANDLRVSVITTKRAYAELEALGFVETIQGKGTFVASGNMEMIHEEHMRCVQALLEDALDKAQVAGIDANEVRDLLDILIEERR